MKKSIKDIQGVELSAKQMKDLKGGDFGSCKSTHCTAFTGSNGTQSGHCKVPGFGQKCKCVIGGMGYDSPSCSGSSPIPGSGGGGGSSDGGSGGDGVPVNPVYAI